MNMKVSLYDKIYDINQYQYDKIMEYVETPNFYVEHIGDVWKINSACDIKKKELVIILEDKKQITAIFK